MDWTLVRPPMLADGEKTGVARVLSTEGGEKAHKIGRAELAARSPGGSTTSLIEAIDRPCKGL